MVAPSGRLDLLPCGQLGAKRTYFQGEEELEETAELLVKIRTEMTILDRG